MTKNNNDDQTYRTSVILPKELYEKVKATSEEHHSTVTWALRYIIADFYKQDKKLEVNVKIQKKDSDE